MDNDIFQLGGNIELSGFNNLDHGILIVIKKMVGSYARKMSDISSNFEKLIITMKLVHEREKSEKYELHAKLMDNGKAVTSSTTDRNPFVAVDAALKKIISEIS